jgi:uncharacterized protein (TIGR03437 family)
VQVTSTGASMAFSVASSATWLSASPANGATPATLNVSVNQSGLGAGSYNGTLTITPATGTAVAVGVRLTVTAAASLTANPALLAFTYRSGEAVPGSQTLTVGSTGRSLTFSVAALGGAWLSAAPSSGATTGQVTVSVNPAGLAPGTHNATLTISGGGGAGSVTVPVALTVSAPLPTVTEVLSGASIAATPLAPGLITVLRGNFIGPADLAQAAPDASGRYPTSVGGVRVLFSGIPGPMLYATSTQVAAIAPFALAGRSQAFVQVEYNGVRSNARTLDVSSTAPALFTLNQSGSGPGAILNQDSSVNSSGNPAARDSVIQIYLTGAGQTVPAGVDGQLNNALGSTVLPSSVTIDGLPAAVQYAGPAPGMPAGVVQVNAVVPAGSRSGDVSVVVTIGNASSQPGVTVAVR